MKNPELGRDDPTKQEDSIIPSQQEEFSAEGNKNRYEVMTPRDVATHKEWVKDAVKKLYDEIKPDYIIMTDTSATPLGWLLKYAWKEMYPEDVPQFRRIDPRPLAETDDWKRPPFANKFFTKRFNKKNARILVFDELRLCGSEEGKLRTHQMTKDDIDHAVGSADRAAQAIYEMSRTEKDKGTQDIWRAHGAPGTYFDHLFRDNNDKIEYVRPTVRSQDGEYKNIIATTEKDPMRRKRALSYVHDLKLAGKVAGEEFRAELTKEKS